MSSAWKLGPPTTIPRTWGSLGAVHGPVGQNVGVATSSRRALSQVLAAPGPPFPRPPDVAVAVCDAVRTQVPYIFGCFATTDPSTGLISWTYKTHPLEVGDEEFAV